MVAAFSHLDRVLAALRHDDVAPFTRQEQELFDTFARGSVIKDASTEAVETSLTKQVIDAAVERLARADEDELYEGSLS